MELAIVTQTPVAGWWTASDAVIATALDVLEEHRKRAERAQKGG